MSSSMPVAGGVASLLQAVEQGSNDSTLQQQEKQQEENLCSHRACRWEHSMGRRTLNRMTELVPCQWLTCRGDDVSALRVMVARPAHMPAPYEPHHTGRRTLHVSSGIPLMTCVLKGQDDGGICLCMRGHHHCSATVSAQHSMQFWLTCAVLHCIPALRACCCPWAKQSPRRAP